MTQIVNDDVKACTLGNVFSVASISLQSPNGDIAKASRGCALVKVQLGV